MKRNIVEWAMHYRQIVILLTCCLMAFGVYGLSEMKKNEFHLALYCILMATCRGVRGSIFFSQNCGVLRKTL